MPQGSGILRYCNHPLRPPHPSVQSFGMTGTPLKLRTRHGESPITAARTSDIQLSVRKGIAFQSVPLHYIPGRRMALRATRQPSIPLHSFTLYAHSGEAERKQSDKPTALFLPKAVWQWRWIKRQSASYVGQDRQADYLFIPHHCRITARWVGRLVG